MADQEYQLTWITDHLAAGHAPMSFAELESLRRQGIDAIVNLCAEYCDLHDIEKDSGFQVYYLPVRDDQAPDPAEVEKALEWLDEAIYLGKKVFVHCRLGIGRTGTFITSYLLRRGFGLKLAEKHLKKTRFTPTSFSQWRFLRKYDKKTGRLTIREPSLETGGRRIDLGIYFDEYESVVSQIQDQLGLAMAEDLERVSRTPCEVGDCGRVLMLQLVEAAYLLHHLNRLLSQEERQRIIRNALAAHCAILGASLPRSSPENTVVISGYSEEDPHEVCLLWAEQDGAYTCPLQHDGACLAGARRPIGCRVWSLGPVLSHAPEEGIACPTEAALPPRLQGILTAANEALFEISRRLFLALNGRFLEKCCLVFPLTEVVSGKYVQSYFGVLARMGESRN